MQRRTFLKTAGVAGAAAGAFGILHHPRARAGWGEWPADKQDAMVPADRNGSIVAMRHFLAQKSGKLINLLGRGDKGSIALQNAYSSSKVWVRNFTKALANEYRNSGVDIFGFNPGLVRTEMLSNVYAVGGYEEQMNPLRFVAMLWGNDADVPAEKALWLASPATDGKNGTMVTVLTKRMMLSHLIALPFRKLLNRSTELLPLNVTSVKSAISGD